MARREYKGGAPQLILSGNIAASGVTTINTTGTVTNWPTGATGKFLIVIDKGLASEEKLYCSARSGNALTTSDPDRGADGTSATSHSSGGTVNHVGGAIDLDEPNQHIFDTAQDQHTQYLNSARFITAHDVEARHVFGAGLGAPSAPADVDQATAATGSGDDAAREDHVHAQPAATPRGVGGFTAHTADTGVTTSYADIVSVTLTTVASRRYKITAHVHANISAADHAVFARLVEGATLFSSDSVSSAGFSTAVGALHMEAIVTPSAASHTYKIQAFATLNGISVIGDSTNGPGFIIVEDIGV